jgi:hypothetical protein
LAGGEEAALRLGPPVELPESLNVARHAIKPKLNVGNIAYYATIATAGYAAEYGSEMLVQPAISAERLGVAGSVKAEARRDRAAVP